MDVHRLNGCNGRDVIALKNHELMRWKAWKKDMYLLIHLPLENTKELNYIYLIKFLDSF